LHVVPQEHILLNNREVALTDRNGFDYPAA
jgi:hypothetical protein